MDVRLDGVVMSVVDDNNLIESLTDTVTPADPPFDPHWIPREVVVDEGATFLNIESLAGRVRTHENVDPTVVGSEPRLNSLFLDRRRRILVTVAHLATAIGIRRDRLGLSGDEAVANVIHRIGIPGEDHDAAVPLSVKFVDVFC